MQALPAQPESLCIVEMGGTEKQDELGERGSIGFLYLNIGLQVRNPEALIVGVRPLGFFMHSFFQYGHFLCLCFSIQWNGATLCSLFSARIRAHKP